MVAQLAILDSPESTAFWKAMGTVLGSLSPQTEFGSRRMVSFIGEVSASSR
jgi:hypothetical protein